MSKAEYVPAQGEQLSSVYKRGLEYNGFDMKYWNDKSHFKHNILLQSCYYGIEGVTKGTNFREALGITKDVTVIGDSGGFQIASFKKKGEVCNITPIDSLRWQEANCDIGMNLDIPPNLGGKPSYDDFNKALDESVENFKLFEKERKNYDMKLLNVLHGETIPLAERWYNKVKDFKFDGWAIGMKPPWSPMLQALGFMYLYEKGEFNKETCKHIHFFGTSGKHVCPTLVYCASKVKQRVTYDSSSYNIGSIFRTYYQPFDIGPHLSFGNKFDGNKDTEKIKNWQTITGEQITNTEQKGKNPNIKRLPCRCQVCNSIKDIHDLNKTDIFAGTLISLHNMYQYIQYNDILNSLVDEKELFINYIKTIIISENTLKSIEFIDFAIEHGLEKAMSKFKNEFDCQELDKTKQSGIFGF